MASVHELLGIQNVVRMSGMVHVVEDIHLQKDQSETDSTMCSWYILRCVYSHLPWRHKHLYVLVLILYLNSELIAGVASIHLSAGQMKLSFIKSSAVVDVV